MDLRVQHITFFILSIAAALALGTLAARHPALFKPFLGPVHPLIAVGAAAVVGAIALQYLMHAEGFVIVDRKRVSGALLAASILGTGFGFAIIGVEIWFVRYPQDMNVALPEALLFYPGM
jgi:hypothetical protein